MANPRVKSSYVAGEVRASVVAALLAARRAQVLPTWRVRSAATELGVSVRTVWRWLEVAESEDRLGRKSRPCFAGGQDDLVELAYYRGNVSALRVARIGGNADAEHRRVPCRFRPGVAAGAAGWPGVGGTSPPGLRHVSAASTGSASQRLLGG